MNVLALLEEELKNKNWTTEEKIRYLYLRSCEIFSYDPRYFLLGSIENGEQMQKEIRDHVIDLEHVEIPWSVCTSHTESVLSVLLKELLNKESNIITIFDHKESSIEDEVHGTLILDPTRNFDYTAVKTLQSTGGYYQQNKSTRAFYNDLRKKDQKIGYIESEYSDEHRRRRSKHLYDEYLALHGANNESEKSDDFLLYRLREIEKEVEKCSNLKEVSDLKKYISTLKQSFLGDDYGRKSATISLYQMKSEYDWEFANIYPIELENDMIYYALTKEKDHYSYREISKEDAISYTKNYEGRNKQYIHHF